MCLLDWAASSDQPLYKSLRTLVNKQITIIIIQLINWFYTLIIKEKARL